MKEVITPEMIAKCQQILKQGEYDFDKFTVEVGPMAPCSVVQGLFPDILDMALEHLKRKASHSLVEWMDIPEAKTCNIDVVFNGGKVTKKLKNYTIPFYELKEAQ